MEIKLVPASSLPTEEEFDGKEFVSLDTFLTAFNLDENVEIGIRSLFESRYINSVQKRDEDDLLQELSNKCLGKREAYYSPIITKDGWVYWVSGGMHRALMEALAELYSNGEHTHQDFVLSCGIAWQICSLRPNTIMHGRNYIPTRNDKKIFELFNIEVIDF